MLKAWRKHLSKESNDRQRDSIEFLESAFSKWHLYRSRNRTSSSKNNLVQLIGRDPVIDALAILKVNAWWAGLDGDLGICQIRRTWRNNITIDYLAVHPALLESKKLISGVGTALLYSVAVVANELAAGNVWLETTDLSANYYGALLDLNPVSDLVIVPTKKFHEVLRSYVERKSSK